MAKKTLGIAMNMQNEEVHIPAALSQFFPICDDIVCVDGGSSDGTVAWAQRLGARVFHRPWKHNYAEQKNFACQQLKTDWIYVHDPDERLEPTLIEILPLLLEEDGQRFLMGLDIIPDSGELFDAFGVARKNFIDGVMTEHYPDYQYRLFERTCFYSADPQHRIHQEIEGFKKRTEIDYRHKTKEDPARFNILHYKSSQKQKEHDILFPKILRGEMDG